MISSLNYCLCLCMTACLSYYLCLNIKTPFLITYLTHIIRSTRTYYLCLSIMTSSSSLSYYLSHIYNDIITCLLLMSKHNDIVISFLLLMSNYNDIIAFFLLMSKHNDIISFLLLISKCIGIIYFL